MRRFALDHNFPQPIVAVLSEFQAEAQLARIDAIDPRMSDLDDWELIGRDGGRLVGVQARSRGPRARPARQR
jgi:hypothetical protein